MSKSRVSPLPPGGAPAPSSLSFLAILITFLVLSFEACNAYLEPNLRFLLALPLCLFGVILAYNLENLRVKLLTRKALVVLPEHVLKVKDLSATFDRIDLLGKHPLLNDRPEAVKVVTASSLLHEELLEEHSALFLYSLGASSLLSVNLRSLELDRQALLLRESEEALSFMLKERQHQAFNSSLGSQSEASAATLSSLLVNSEFTRFCLAKDKN